MFSKYTLQSFLFSCLFVNLLMASDDCAAQFKNINEVYITLGFKDAPVQDAFKQIEALTDFTFSYSSEDIAHGLRVTVTPEFQSVGDVLYSVARQTGLTFRQINNNITVAAGKYAPAAEDPPITVTGVIHDEFEAPLVAVNIFVKGTTRGTTSDVDGQYTMRVDASDTLVFSMIGYQTITEPINGRAQINVQMQPDVSTLEDVVVTGIVVRDKENFTGAVYTATAADLKAVGNQNVIQSLKTLDPSMVVVDNNSLGSNPNALPTIEIRGKTSVSTETIQDQFGTDPNQPLFILNGFETTLSTIVNLNMNRVASITILKDASSTALYGAKAANGVIVVETKKPEEGAIRISYTGDYRVEWPDLSDYNLMNAKEKMEFEEKVGRWTLPYLEDQLALDETHNQIKRDIASGVDTYWLSEPVQTAFTHGHYIYADGGNDELQFGVGVNYKFIDGVMKGSGKEQWGGHVDLTYRRGKVNISNKLYLNGYTGKESPYGSFADFAEASPYYKKRNDEGGLGKYLDVTGVWENLLSRSLTEYYIPNPLYNASLNSKDETKNSAFQNNLQLMYYIKPELKLQGGVQVASAVTTEEYFKSPDHTDYRTTSTYEKGEYVNTRTDNFSYQANMMLTYARLFADKHRFTANVRADIEETHDKRFVVTAVGFPSGTNGNPAFAFSYEDDSSPATADKLYRRNNVLASVNYVYDDRFLVDATYRLDGATAFGSDKRYAPFWSAGLGWNLHHELDLSAWGVSRLRVRGSVGLTGNQNFGSITSTSVYSYQTSVNLFGQGVVLQTLANPDLDWQNTLTTNLGVDFTMFHNRLNGTINYFDKDTDPLVVALDIPASTGTSSYPTNAGGLVTHGVDFNIKYSVIYKPQQRVVWTLGITGNAYSSYYTGVNKAFASLNEAQQENSTLVRYRDGNSPDAIWAVPSLGVDPATGYEVYVKRNGESTFVYDVDDAVAVGNTRPDIEGVISSNLNYKGITFGINLRYRYGGQVYNTALYNKVENITGAKVITNLDKRALYDRWFEPGDIAKYKAVTLMVADANYSTPPSSRFVQHENVIIGESINMGYRVDNKGWLQFARIQSLQFNAYMNDIFRVTTVKSERGIDYPFSRAVAFSVNATF